MIAIEDVWAGRDGLLDEICQLRKDLAEARAERDFEKQLNLQLTEGVSPWPGART